MFRSLASSAARQRHDTIYKNVLILSRKKLQVVRRCRVFAYVTLYAAQLHGKLSDSVEFFDIFPADVIFMFMKKE